MYYEQIAVTERMATLRAEADRERLATVASQERRTGPRRAARRRFAGLPGRRKGSRLRRGAAGACAEASQRTRCSAGA